MNNRRYEDKIGKSVHRPLPAYFSVAGAVKSAGEALALVIAVVIICLVINEAITLLQNIAIVIK